MPIPATNGLYRAALMAMNCWRDQAELVTVDFTIAKKAAQRIESCEHCHPNDAEIPFDWLLAEVTGKRESYEFMLSEPARCPHCKHEITEKTLIVVRFLLRIRTTRSKKIPTRSKKLMIPKLRCEKLLRPSASHSVEVVVNRRNVRRQPILQRRTLAQVHRILFQVICDKRAETSGL
jgi:hypothetical protein